MRYIFLSFIFVVIFLIGCNQKTEKVDSEIQPQLIDDTIVVKSSLTDIVKQHFENKEIIPFAYNSSDYSYSGTFVVSPEYYAEVILNPNSGNFRIFINGTEVSCNLKYDGDREDLQLESLSIRPEDYNEDGYMDFRLSVYRDSGTVYVFDKDKKCFLAAPKEDYHALKKTIDNTVGFITFPDPGEKDGLKDKAEIVNKDGTPWMSFHIDYSRYNEKYRDNFMPWAFEPGIGVFVVRCTKVNADSYTIVVNEALGLKKQLKKNPDIKFSTLEEHIFSALLGFDKETNPMRKEPNDNAEEYVWSTDEKFDPELLFAEEMKGDWIKLKIHDWSDGKEYPLGWIKWRDGNRFMIEFYYSV